MDRGARNLLKRPLPSECEEAEEQVDGLEDGYRLDGAVEVLGEEVPEDLRPEEALESCGYLVCADVSGAERLALELRTSCCCQHDQARPVVLDELSHGGGAVESSVDRASGDVPFVLCVTTESSRTARLITAGYGEHVQLAMRGILEVLLGVVQSQLVAAMPRKCRRITQTSDAPTRVVGCGKLAGLEFMLLVPVVGASRDGEVLSGTCNLHARQAQALSADALSSKSVARAPLAFHFWPYLAPGTC